MSVLRITRLACDQGTPCLRVEGRLVGEWVEVLEAEVARSERPDETALDLAGVDFADARALALLRTLSEQGMRVLACSPFLENLLGRSER